MLTESLISTVTQMDQLAYDFRKSLSTGKDGNTLGFEAFTTVLKKSEDDPSVDLFKHIREVLIVGRILGVLPISGVFKHSYSHLIFKRKSIAAVVSILIASILTVNLVLASIQWIRVPKRNALEIAQSVHRTAQYFWGWIIYITFLLNARKFVDLFKSWAKASSLVFYSVEDKTLRRDSIFICSLIMVSCVFENAVLHLEYVKELDDVSGAYDKYDKFRNISTNQSFLETYYWRSNRHWWDILGYNGFLAALAFIQHKWMLYSWNYLDIIIAVFARALYFKFKTLYELSDEYLGHPQSNGGELSKGTKTMNRAAWLQIVTDHKQIHDLLQVIEEFFSHLIFGSYAVNIYYICIQLLIGLSPDITVTSLVQSIYGPWSFIHMVIRVYIVSLCAARINMYAHQIRKVLGDCPVELYNGEIARVDKRITSGPQIGLTGLGCFVVTKPFILSILSVVFTFEIVLLQGVSSNANSSTHIQCCCPTTK
ncbi:unnamed protein product [Orchesella dallaii]|uniref:Gustatory receptor n=1 Tax=Orchesella dallaii TaxID=48710 RepID=A0ABP1Q8E6_9HEXA